MVHLKPLSLLLLASLLLPLLLLYNTPCVAATKECPQGCTTYGTCYEPLGRQGCVFLYASPSVCHGHASPSCLPKLCRCDCPWNRTGAACLDHSKGFCIRRPDGANIIDTCTEGHPTLCLNACNGRGKCMGGFCHCDKGGRGGERRGSLLIWSHCKN